MTVRQWFRLNRASLWLADLPPITIYFRNSTSQGPLTPRTDLYNLIDYQKLLVAGAPRHIEDVITEQLHREMDEIWRHAAEAS